MPTIWEPLHDTEAFLRRHLVGLSWYEGEVNANGELTHHPDYHTASAFVADVADKRPKLSHHERSLESSGRNSAPILPPPPLAAGARRD